jgi:hypothetical protein
MHSIYNGRSPQFASALFIAGAVASFYMIMMMIWIMMVMMSYTHQVLAVSEEILWIVLSKLLPSCFCYFFLAYQIVQTQ